MKVETDWWVIITLVMLLFLNYREDIRIEQLETYHVEKINELSKV